MWLAMKELWSDVISRPSEIAQLPILDGADAIVKMATGEKSG